MSDVAETHLPAHRPPRTGRPVVRGAEPVGPAATATRMMRRTVELATLVSDHPTAVVHLRAEGAPSAVHGRRELADDPAAREVCARAVATGSAVLVGHLTAAGDDRAVARSCAAFPVTMPDGAVVGALCVVDAAPRRLGSPARRALELLAQQLGTALELERERRLADDEARARATALAQASRAEAVLQALLDHAQGPVYAKDLAGRFVLANTAAHKVLGLDPGTVVGHRLEDFWPADVAEPIIRNDAAVAVEGPQVFAETAPGPTGELREYLASKFPLRDASGAVWGVGGISIDVSATRDLAEQLSVTEDRYRSLAESSRTAALVTAGPDLRVLWCNEAAARVNGSGLVRRLVGRSLLDLAEADERDQLRVAYARVLDGEPLRTRMHRPHRAGKGRSTIDVTARRMVWEGQPAVLTEIVDVSDEAARTERAERSERRLSALFDQAPVGYAEATPSGHLVAVNRRLADLLERTAGTLQDDVLVADVVVPTDRPRLREAVRAVGSGAEGVTVGCTMRTRTGRHIPVQVHVDALREEQGAVTAIAVMVLDDRDAARRRDELDTRGRHAELLLGALPEGVVVADVDGLVIEVNTHAATLLGRSRDELVGLSYTDLVPDPGDQLLLRAATGLPAASRGLVVRVARGDGTTVPVDVLIGSTELDGARTTVTTLRASSHSSEAAPGMLTALLDAAVGQAVLATDLDGRITAANSGAETLLDRPADLVVGRRLDDFVDEADLADLFAQSGDPAARWLGLTQDVGTDRTRLCRYRTSSGDRRDVLQSITVREGPGGHPTGLLVVATDVTEHMEAVLQLADSEQRYRLAFDNASTGMALVGLAEPVRGRYLQVNQSLCELLGYAEDELVGTPVASVVDPDNLSEGMDVMGRLVRGELESFRGERRFRRADGTPVWVDLSVALARDRDGAPAYVVSQYQDVTARRAAEDALTRAALYDGLTGLANRALLVDHLEQEIARARRTGRRLGLIYLDLDNFKDVNDSLGHDAGDLLLTEVADRLRGCVRDVDTTARLGGDEFVVLCTGLESIDELVALARRIEHVLALDISVGATSLSVTASVGLAFPDSDDVRAEDLLRDADAAMYQAKRNGRHRYEVADPTLQARALRQVSLEAELRQALRDAEETDGRSALHLVYQPGFDATTGRLVSVEALLRWDHPVRGLLLPGAFLDVAEERALMWPLGLWILRTAIAQAGRWRAQHGDDAPQMWVNVSAGQLGRNQLAEEVLVMLAEQDVPPSALCLELTERQVVRSAHSTMDDLETLRAAGVDVAVDDFGTGHAGMEYLRRLPVSMMKIDRLFISEIDDDPTQAALTASMVAMGRSMNLRVVAEGVETAAQHAAVVRLGCDLAQGFLLARPGEVDEVDALLTAGRGALRA